MNNKISEKVVSRLTLYHSILIEYLEEGVELISSPQIASRLGVDDSQVRKDFLLLKKSGVRRIGYSVRDLKDAIEKSLGFTQKKDAFIIGAGCLGLALAKYDNFSHYGLNILALFDNDPLKVDMQIGDKQIFHISKLSGLIQSLNVDIAILTVPRAQTQKVTDMLVNSGIKYIWNFTPSVLKVPPEIKVWNENLMASFLQFACKDIEVKND